MNGQAVGITMDAFLGALPSVLKNWFFDQGQWAKNRVDADEHPGRRSAQYLDCEEERRVGIRRRFCKRWEG